MRAAFGVLVSLWMATVLAASPPVTRIADMAQFSRLAVTVEGDSYVKFLIDRTEGLTHYIDSKPFPFHYEYALSLFPKLSVDQFNAQTYFTPNRRFVAGTLGWHPAFKVFTLEFWEGDFVDASVFTLTRARLGESFFERNLAFKPNSLEQESLAGKLTGVRILTSDELYKSIPFKVYNPGTAVGRLRVLRTSKEVAEASFDPHEIVLLDLVPSDITPVAGILCTRFSTPLSHMNLRAYAWRVPNMVLKSALTDYGKLNGQVVSYRCGLDGYELRQASADQIRRYETALDDRVRITLQADLKFSEMGPLGRFGRQDSALVGVKGANLSEMCKQGGLAVPAGFCIPFSWFQQFMEANGLNAVVKATLEEKRFKQDVAYRKKCLAALKEKIKSAPHTEGFRKAFLAAVHPTHTGKGLFVRSSTNCEDLKGFNGAGLYDSVPNVKGDEALLAAVKVVWASIYNFRAHQEREHFGVDHFSVRAAVVCCESVDATAAGVLITTDIYDDSFPGSITINAKKGLGLTVVDGRSIPEQVVYEPYYDSVRVISRSDDHTQIVIGVDGGVVERPVSDRSPVLSGDDVRSLGKAAARIREIFRSDGIQDVEWVIRETAAPITSRPMRDVWIVQSRPYLGGGTAKTAPAPITGASAPATRAPTSTPSVIPSVPLPGVRPGGRP